MSMILLSGVGVSKLRFTISAYGLWWAEVVTQFSEGVLAALPPGGALLAIADSPWVGTIVAGGEENGVGRWHVVGGFGGWGKQVLQLGYHSPGGVSPALVLADTAAIVQEVVVPDVPLLPRGEHFTRAAGTAMEVLNGIAPAGWYVDSLGITHVGERLTGIVPPSVELALSRTRVDASMGLVEYTATDSITGLLPGLTIPLTGEIRDMEIVYDSEDDAGLRVLCYCETGGVDSRLEAYAAIFNALDPLRKFRASYECRVVAQVGDKFTLQPIRTGHGIPILTGVPYRPGIGGAKFIVAPGSTVMVSFEDGDPSRPYVSAFEKPGSPVWEPIRIEFGGPAALGIAYQGSPVVAGPFAGAVTLGSTRVAVTP